MISTAAGTGALEGYLNADGLTVTSISKLSDAQNAPLWKFPSPGTFSQISRNGQCLVRPDAIGKRVVVEACGDGYRYQWWGDATTGKLRLTSRDQPNMALNVTTNRNFPPVSVVDNTTMGLHYSASLEYQESLVDVAVTSPSRGSSIPRSGTTFSGTATPGHTVRIIDADNKQVGTATANQAGAWTTNLTLPIGAASLTFTAGSRSATWTGNVFDNSPGSIFAPAAGATIEPGTLFWGTGPRGGTVLIKDVDGVVIGTTRVDEANGYWDTRLDSVPKNGPFEVTIEFINTQGDTVNVLPRASYTMTKSIDEFRVVSPDFVSGQVNTLANGTIFTGTGEPGATATFVIADGTVVGETTVDESGEWTATISGIPQGPNTLDAKVIQPNGQEQLIVLGEIVIVQSDESTPLLDPVTAGGAASVLIAAAGTLLAVRRRQAVTPRG